MLTRNSTQWLGQTHSLPVIPLGHRVYAIGDVHGQSVLMQMLLEQIEQDSEQRGRAEVTLIFLGDLIDRGAGSARLLKAFSEQGQTADLIVLQGNHEAALIDTFRGNSQAAKGWFSFGGAATLAGFGVDVTALDPNNADKIIAAVRKAIPENIIGWLARLPIYFRFGDYLFVHAGIKPGLSLDCQTKEDLQWIRGEFLRSKRNHGFMVVHGHSEVSEGPEILSNRINVDTAAYMSGRLTAIGLEAAEQWVVQVKSASSILVGNLAV